MTEFDAVLLTSFGGPEGPEDVEPFLRNVAKGRDIPEKRIREVEAQYGLFGGVSPINKQNRDLIKALKSDFHANGLKIPIYFGNRNWEPYVADTLQQLYEDGKRNILAVVTSAFGSYSGCRQYQEDLDAAVKGLGVTDLNIEKIRLYWNHPGFFQAMCEQLRHTLSLLSPEDRDQTRIVFTAHSIPTAWDRSNPYKSQLNKFAYQLANTVAPELEWDLAFQSRSGPPSVPWLEPDILDHLDFLEGEGVNSVVITPIGFISDHMEVMFDLDTEAVTHAQKLDIKVLRTHTVGTHPDFVSGLRQLIQERINNLDPLAVFDEPWVCTPTCCSVAQRPSSGISK